MPGVYLSPGPPIQQFNQNGVPLAGGKLFTYASNTVTKLATYTDYTGATPNPNPIILDANGQAQIWLLDEAYTYVLSPATDTDPPTNAFWTVNGIVGMNSAFISGAVSQSVAASPAPPGSLSVQTMQGLAGSVTPQRSGNVQVAIGGTIVSTSGTAGIGIGYQIYYGVGAAPANGAALTGTPIGPIQQYANQTTVTAADVLVPFSISGLLTGLNIGTAYWIDLAAIALGAASDCGLSEVYTGAGEL